MTSPYLHSPMRSRRGGSSWRRWLLVIVGLAVLFLAPALAHSDPAPVTRRPAGEYGRTGCATFPVIVRAFAADNRTLGITAAELGR